MKFKYAKNLQTALNSENGALFVKVPHVDLHCHSVLSAPFEAFQKLSADLLLPPKQFKNIQDFNLYLKKNINPLVKDIETIRFLLNSTFQRLINEGVIYTEMSFDLTVPSFIGVSMGKYLEMINDEKNRVSKKLKVCIEAGIDREINPQKSFKLLKEALNQDVIESIDLYGDELAAPIKIFADLYKLAGAHDLKLKAHVGEIGSALSIKEAIETLNLDAIQHGIKAAEDSSVMSFLAKRGIPLNVCPSSNLSLGLVKDLKSHPIRKLFGNGVTITVGSDDFSIFNQSVGSELINLYRTGILSEEEIEQIIINGLNQINYE